MVARNCNNFDALGARSVDALGDELPTAATLQHAIDRLSYMESGFVNMISLYTCAERSSGFPNPVARVTSNSLLWDGLELHDGQADNFTRRLNNGVPGLYCCRSSANWGCRRHCH